MAEKQKSTHWDERSVTYGRNNGFPFNEGLPLEYLGKKFTLINRQGKRLPNAVVMEKFGKISWVIKNGSATINETHVAAWQEQ